MRIVIVAIVFIISVFIRLEPVGAREPQSREDSIAAAERIKAIADFQCGKFKIPAYRVTCNSYYAEEIFWKLCGVKVEFYHDWNMCGTGMDEYYFAEKCYYNVIDSLMLASFGEDIYDRISREGELLQRHEPGRYPSDDDPFGLQRGYRGGSADSILKEHIQYPPSAKRDSVQGTVYVLVHFDSTGKVTGTSVMKGVRSDLDSAAMEGAKFLQPIDPEFRWGAYRSGSFVIPIKFALRE